MAPKSTKESVSCLHKFLLHFLSFLHFGLKNHPRFSRIVFLDWIVLVKTSRQQFNLFPSTWSNNSQETSIKSGWRANTRTLPHYHWHQQVFHLAAIRRHRLRSYITSIVKEELTRRLSSWNFTWLWWVRSWIFSLEKNNRYHPKVQCE